MIEAQTQLDNQLKRLARQLYINEPAKPSKQMDAPALSQNFNVLQKLAPVHNVTVYTVYL